MDLKASKKRRSLPGPAGMLPKVLKPTRKRTSLDPKPANGVHQDTSFSILNETDDASDSPENEALFSKVRADCGLEAWSIVSQYSIANIHRMASEKGFPRGKIPVMCAALDKVDNIFPDAKAVLTDPSGSIGCTIDRSVLRRHKRYLISGTVLLLKQVSLFSLNWKTFYLNVTQSNIVRVYLEGPISPVDPHPPTEVEVVMPASGRPSGPTLVGLPPFSVANLKELVSECLDPLPQPEDEENSVPNSRSIDASSPSSRRSVGLPYPGGGFSSRQSRHIRPSSAAVPLHNRPSSSHTESLTHPEGERCWRLTDREDNSCPAAILRVPPAPRKSGGLKALLGTGVVSTTTLKPSASQPVLPQSSPRVAESPSAAPPRDPELTRPLHSACTGTSTTTTTANDDTASNESGLPASLLEDDMDELLASVVAE